METMPPKNPDNMNAAQLFLWTIRLDRSKFFLMNNNEPEWDDVSVCLSCPDTKRHHAFLHFLIHSILRRKEYVI